MLKNFFRKVFMDPILGPEHIFFVILALMALFTALGLMSIWIWPDDTYRIGIE